MNSIKTAALGTAWALSAGLTYYLGLTQSSSDTLIPTETVSKNYVKDTEDPVVSGQGKKVSSTSASKPRHLKKKVTKRISIQATMLDISTVLSNGGQMNFRGFVKAWNTMESLNEKELLEAIDIIDAMPNGQAKMTMQMISLSRWAEFSPQDALSHVASAKKGMQSWIGRSAVISTWAETDPDAALKWVAEQSKEGNLSGGSYGMGSSQYYSSIFNSLAVKGVDNAFEKLGDLKGQDRQMALMGLASGLKNTDDRREFLKLADGLKKSEKESAYTSVMSQWVVYDPDDAVSFVDEMEEGASKGKLVEQLSASWLSSDPENAADWVLGQANDGNKEKAVNKILENWGRQDPAKAASWLEEQGIEANDTQKSKLARQMMFDDPEKGMKWATAIEDSATQSKAISKNFRIWRSQDQQAAEKFLDQSNLSDDQKKSLMEEKVRSSDKYNVWYDSDDEIKSTEVYAETVVEEAEFDASDEEHDH